MFVRSVVFPSVDTADGPEGAVLGVDVGLLNTAEYVRFLTRPATAGFSQRLSEFFFAAAGDVQPETSVPVFADPLSGLQCSVESSTETQVELLVEIVEDATVEDPESHGVNFLTSRAALAQAARDVRILESVDDEPVAVAVPPSEWS